MIDLTRRQGIWAQHSAPASWLAGALCSFSVPWPAYRVVTRLIHPVTAPGSGRRFSPAGISWMS